jgi:hypothetical protein
MYYEQKAQVIEEAASAQCGVRDAVQMLPCKTARAVSLLKEMEQERLIELKQVASSRRGRPKKIIVCTPLGLEFLEAYRRVRVKPLRSRKVDLEHAVQDARYVERLVARNLSPFKLFMELNMIASNIKVSSEATGSI